MEIIFERLPKDIASFEALARPMMIREHESAALFIVALNAYAENAAEGLKMINFLKGPVLLTKRDEMFLRDRFMGGKYLANAYFSGASPENNYTPLSPWKIVINDDKIPPEPGYKKVFVVCGGADTPRPIMLREKDGVYFVWEYSSILSGVKRPAASGW
jgi:hypothetical protein